MQLKKHFVGTIDLSLGKVDVTDPCYKRDVWCRMNEVPVIAGTYNCYTFLGEDEGWGYRPWIARIALSDKRYNNDIAKAIENEKWEIIGQICVDSGMAGFFANKPDFDADDWAELSNMSASGKFTNDVYQSYIKDYGERGGQGFWTASGAGDGDYDVCAILYDGTIAALEIRY